MSEMEEGKIDVVVKLKREQRKKDEPPKLYGKKLSIFQIKVTFVWNNVIAFCITVFFFWKHENLGRSDDANQRKKKGMALQIFYCQVELVELEQDHFK